MRLVKADTLTVAVAVREPFAFQKDGEWTGFDVEVAREIAKEAGLKTEIVKAERDRLKQLKDRKVDMVTSVPTSGKRKDGASVTDPYYQYKVQFTVNKEATPNVAKPDDVTSGKIATPEETQAAAVAQETFEEAVEVETFPTLEQACAALALAEFKGLLSDDQCAASTPGAEKLGATEIEGLAGIGVAEDNDELFGVLKSALERLSGGLPGLIQKYGLPPESAVGGASPTAGAAAGNQFEVTITFTSGMDPPFNATGVATEGDHRSCSDWATRRRSRLRVPIPAKGTPESGGIFDGWKISIIEATIAPYEGVRTYEKGIEVTVQLEEEARGRGRRGTWGWKSDTKSGSVVATIDEDSGNFKLTDVPPAVGSPVPDLNGTISWTCLG
jgi:ABC-type amino acid transport substrate-binding protein